MKIDFLTFADKLFFETPRKIKAAVGEPSAKKLQSRLDDLHAAPNMEMMRSLPGSWEELKGDRKGQFSARLQDGRRLIVRPQKNPAYQNRWWLGLAGN
ncbi:MAG: killer suppression protein [Polaromonas sp.]|nr:killer suppression protein [Polaromonas sp.]